MRLAHKSRGEVDPAGLRKVYDEIDLPLVPCWREWKSRRQAGLRSAGGMSQRWSSSADKAREIYDKSGFEFGIDSAKQLGDVLFNRLNLPKPIKYGKSKTISTAVDVLEGLAGEHEVPRMVLDYRQLSEDLNPPISMPCRRC